VQKAMHQFILTLGNLQGHVLLDEGSRYGQLRPRVNTCVNKLLNQALESLPAVH